MEKHKYPSILDTWEHLQNWGTFVEDSRCFLPAFWLHYYQKMSSAKIISLILLIFSSSSDSLIRDFWLFSSTLNILPYLLCWLIVPHWGCLGTTYLKISTLRLFFCCLLENFLIQAALQLLTWEFPLWGCLVTAYFKIPHWIILVRGAIKKKKLPNFGHCPNMGGGQRPSQTFFRKKVWTCFKGGGGSKGLVQSSFL